MKHNTLKRVLSLVLALVLCLGAVPAFAPSASAATTNAASIDAFDCLSDSKYAKIYAVNTGTIIPYTSETLSDRGTITYGRSSNSYIDGYNDLLYVMDVGINSSGVAWAKLSYPVAGNKRVIAYVKLSDLTANTHSIRSVSTGKFLCSLRQNGGLSSSYYVAKSDVVWLLAVAGNRVQILYPSGSLYRIAWADKSDYEKCCGAISGTTSGSANTADTSVAGMVDVTAYFAGKTITMQSVQNGQYLGIGSSTGAPLQANQNSAGFSCTFRVSGLTADGWVAIKASNGKYLRATANASGVAVRAIAGSIQSWECFRIYQKGGDFYLKAQANGKWLCVRVDKSGAPVQAYANAASTWERIRIRVLGEELYVSPAEIIQTAAENGIAIGSNAYKALCSLNSKYAPQLSSTEEKGTVVALFEGVGSDASAGKRMNAMALVIKNGDIVYLNRNSTTIPDRPFDTSSNRGTDVPTLKSGVHSFTTTNHPSQKYGYYAALNVTNAPVVRFANKSSFYSSRSSDINVHSRSQNYIITSGTPNSAGCMNVGMAGMSSTGEYARFIQTLGIVGSGARGDTRYTTYITGRIIVDRTYAYSYLSNIGYSDTAIKMIG